MLDIKDQEECQPEEEEREDRCHCGGEADIGRKREEVGEVGAIKEQGRGEDGEEVGTIEELGRGEDGEEVAAIEEPGRGERV